MHEELLAIPGIASAEFEGDPDAPDGVRVQLAPGADPDLVGREVSRVLAGHGMRSHLSAPSVAPQAPPPPPPPEPRTVVNLADFDHKAPADAGGRAAAVDNVAEGGAEAVPMHEDADATSGAADPAPEAMRAEEGDRAASEAPAGVPSLVDVTVTQGGDSVGVSVTIGDRTSQRRAVASDAGIDLALVGAVAELLGVEPVPTIVAITMSEHEGSPIVSVLLDDGSMRRSGSAVVRGSRAWAVTRAFWSALSGPA